MEIDKLYNDFIKDDLHNLGIPDFEEEKFKSKLTLLKLYKNEYLEREGEDPDKIGFIITGLFRAFYLTSNGDEKTIVFREQGDIVSAYSSYINNEACKFSIQALENSTLLYITIKDLEELMESNNCWRIITGEYYQKIYIEKEARERDLLSNNAKENYLIFLKEYPGLIDKINHYYIASYLGISYVTLSRIRKELSKN